MHTYLHYTIRIPLDLNHLFFLSKSSHLPPSLLPLLSESGSKGSLIFSDTLVLQPIDCRRTDNSPLASNKKWSSSVFPFPWHTHIHTPDSVLRCSGTLLLEDTCWPSVERPPILTFTAALLPPAKQPSSCKFAYVCFVKKCSKAIVASSVLEIPSVLPDIRVPLKQPHTCKVLFRLVPTGISSLDLPRQSPSRLLHKEVRWLDDRGLSVQRHQVLFPEALPHLSHCHSQIYDWINTYINRISSENEKKNIPPFVK